MRTARRFPASRPRITELVANSISGSVRTDKSYKIFASPRLVRFMEMENGIALEAVPEALQRVRSLTDDLDVPPLIPVEVRVSAPDDIALSTAGGRRTGWIAAHQYPGVNYGEYFCGVEAIMDDYDGRPHWGKSHYQDAATLEPRYPQWDRFRTVRSKTDPDGIFANAYTDRVLGPRAHLTLTLGDRHLAHRHLAHRHLAHRHLAHRQYDSRSLLCEAVTWLNTTW